MGWPFDVTALTMLSSIRRFRRQLSVSDAGHGVLIGALVSR